jgi:glycosyltransferase involved in cell wall biosynthesis
MLSVIVTPFDPPRMYGAELSCVELSDNLARLGAKVWTLERAPSFGRSTKLASKSFEVNGVSSSPLGLLKLTINVIQACKSTTCDLIYSYHVDFGESLLPAFFASLVANRPLMVAVHDDLNRNEDSLDLITLIKKKLKSTQADSNQSRITSFFRQLSFTIIRRIACRFAILCLTPSFFAADYARTLLHAQRVFVMGQGIDTAWFVQPNGTVTEEYDAVFFGRIDEYKGVDVLLNAWKDVIAKKSDAKLLVIGSAQSSDQGTKYFSEMIQLSKELGISNNITFSGYIQNINSVRKLISASRLFVFPSKKEGFGRVVSEAMACGCPCIVSDIPAFREVYSSAAVLVPVGDYKKLSEAILILLENPEKRRMLIEKGLELANQKRWSVIGDKVLKVIERSLSSS